MNKYTGNFEIARAAHNGYIQALTDLHERGGENPAIRDLWAEESEAWDTYYQQIQVTPND